MGSITPDPKKRDYLLPPGCKNLGDLLPHSPKNFSMSNPRVNGKIRSPEVQVIGEPEEQLGIMPLADALTLARSRGIDLVEIEPKAKPPLCRIVDFGKFRYEEAKKQKRDEKTNF